MRCLTAWSKRMQTSRQCECQTRNKGCLLPQRSTHVVFMQAEKEAETSRIHMQQLLAERQAEQMRETIQNEMYLAKQRMLADSDFYR